LLPPRGGACRVLQSPFCRASAFFFATLGGVSYGALVGTAITMEAETAAIVEWADYMAFAYTGAYVGPVVFAVTLSDAAGGGVFEVAFDCGEAAAGAVAVRSAGVAAAAAAGDGGGEQPKTPELALRIAMDHPTFMRVFGGSCSALEMGRVILSGQIATTSIRGTYSFAVSFDYSSATWARYYARKAAGGGGTVPAPPAPALPVAEGRAAAQCHGGGGAGGGGAAGGVGSGWCGGDEGAAALAVAAALALRRRSPAAASAWVSTTAHRPPARTAPLVALQLRQAAAAVLRRARF